MATLYDAYGKPVQTRQLKDELAAPTLTGIRTLWTDTVASGLTPTRLARLLQAAVEGDHDPYLALAEEMEERDLHYRSVLGTRKLAVSGITAQITPATPSRRDRKIADAVSEMIKRPGVQKGISKLLDALGKGFAVAEIDWQTGQSWEPVALIWRDPKFFCFDQVTRSELRRRDEADPAHGVALEPFKFVRHIPDLKTGIPIRNGLARLVAWCFMFKGYGIKDWMAFLEVFGMPLRLGRYDASASEEDKAFLRAAVANLGTDAAATIPKEMMIEFIHLSNLSGAESLFERAADWFDSQISKAVLGQTMTSDNGSSMAQAKIHNEVRLDIKTADANDLELTLARDLIKPYVDLNFGVQTKYPSISYPVEEPEDTEALARSVVSLVGVGLEVKQAEIREKLGLSEPQDGDKLLRPVGTAPPVVSPDSGLNHRQDCPPCAVALNREGDDIESDLDEIEAPFLDDWEQQMEPLLAPLRVLFERAESYEDLKAGLADLAAEFDDTDQRSSRPWRYRGSWPTGSATRKRTDDVHL